jgi:hypothetical protein
MVFHLLVTVLQQPCSNQWAVEGAGSSSHSRFSLLPAAAAAAAVPVLLSLLLQQQRGGGGAAAAAAAAVAAVDPRTEGTAPRTELRSTSSLDVKTISLLAAAAEVCLQPQWFYSGPQLLLLLECTTDLHSVQ